MTAGADAARTVHSGKLYRFALVYFSFYFLPFPLDFIPFGSLVSAWYQQAFNAVVVWVGEHVLHLGPGAVIIQPTGSGDTLLGWVGAFCVLVLAATCTLFWLLLDRGRERPRVEAALRAYVRYALAAILLSYGFSKLAPMQFPFPGPEHLVRTYGDSSPMGLLWTFMGASPAYQMFAGLAEVVPGLLLLFRRTTTLGALIGTATMANVVALNFCYDVPVKLYSSHLLAAALVILAPEVPRLIGALVPGRSTRTSWMRFGLVSAFRLLIVGGLALTTFQEWSEFGPGAPLRPLAGVYDVETFTLDGEAEPALWSDSTRWRRFIVFGRRPWATVQYMGGTNERFMIEFDDHAGTLGLKVPESPEAFKLSCARPDVEHLRLEGPFRSGRVRVELKKLGQVEFPLTSRGFHWIQELPFNR